MGVYVWDVYHGFATVALQVQALRRWYFFFLLDAFVKIRRGYYLVTTDNSVKFNLFELQRFIYYKQVSCCEFLLL